VIDNVEAIQYTGDIVHRKLVIRRRHDEVRCGRCDSLLYRVLDKSVGSKGIEIKCRKCGLLIKS
jgi:peptide methionine sulfoxide reductase MsrB